MSAALERRYRRLLACYPADYRAVYGEEMLAVLMTGAEPGRRYPRAGETANLLLMAGAMRLRRGDGTTAASRWTDAVAVLGTLLPILILARSLRPVTTGLGWSMRLVSPWHLPGVLTWLRVAVWAIVTVTVLIGWRRVATGVAAAVVLGEAALLGEAAVLVARLPDPRYLPPVNAAACWPLLLAALAAGAVAVTGRRRGVLLIGRLRLTLVGLAAAVAAALPLVVPILATPAVVPVDKGEFQAIPISQRVIFGAAVVLYGVIAATVAAATIGLEPAVRRRLVALLASLVTLFVVVQLSAEISFASAFTAWPVLAGPAQWPVLVGAPVLVLLIGLLAIGRRERTGRLPGHR